jgi:hypothetical protein
MHFITIYDIQQAGCRYGFLPMFCAALSSYAAMEWYRGKRWRAWTPTGPVTQPGYSPGPFCLFFAILTVLTFLLTWGSYYSQRMRRTCAGQRQASGDNAFTCIACRWYTASQ